MARVALEAVLVLAAVAAVFWAALGPPGPATVAWLAVEFAVITGAVLGVTALQPRKGDNDG